MDVNINNLQPAENGSVSSNASTPSGRGSGEGNSPQSTPVSTAAANISASTNTPTTSRSTGNTPASRTNGASTKPNRPSQGPRLPRVVPPQQTNGPDSTNTPQTNGTRKSTRIPVHARYVFVFDMVE